MSYNLNSENSPEFLHPKTNYGINGLDNYLKLLEYHYFSQVSLSNYNVHERGIDLELNLRCSFDLLDLLTHFNSNRWGKSISTTTSPFYSGFNTLLSQNNASLDIEELTILLNDTTIVIKRLYDKSILQQFNTIISEIANHYVYFTKGLTEKPYEIFVPVFEDHMDGQHLNTPKNKPQNYFDFWGIYLDTQEDALIYDLNKNSFIAADLDLSMH